MEYTDILEVTDSTFDYEVLDTQKPSLVYFMTHWSSDCLEHLEMLSEYLEDFKDKIRIYTLDVDKNQRIADRYKIRSVPTIIIFRLGDEAERFSGDFDPIEIKDFLTEFCGQKPKKKVKMAPVMNLVKKEPSPRKTKRKRKSKAKTKIQKNIDQKDRKNKK